MLKWTTVCKKFTVLDLFNIDIPQVSEKEVIMNLEQI